MNEAKLYLIDFYWDGGRRTDLKFGVWADSPGPANEVAIKQWSVFSKEGMDSCDNIDGKETKEGECYTGFACMGDGASSLTIFVNEMKNGNNQKTMILKKILASRGIKDTAKGLKGAKANDALAAAVNVLLNYKTPIIEEEPSTEEKQLPKSGTKKRDRIGSEMNNETETPEPKKQKLDASE